MTPFPQLWLARFAFLVVFSILGCAESTSEPTEPATPTTIAVAPSAPDLADKPLGSGFVVWESNSDGAFRLWQRDLDGGAERRLSRDESGRAHCCAHVAPDGRRLVYLSLPAGQESYPESGAAGELRLLDLASGNERVLVDTARTYFEHRAALWRDDALLIYIDGKGRTLELEVATGTSRMLIEEEKNAHGLLLDPGLRFATDNTPTFAPYDPARRAVLARPSMGGCQPYFSADGRFAFWVAGSGGPIRRIDLASRATTEILRKGDQRLPPDRRYLYFPMVARSGGLLAWGASNGDHDHGRADYDIFVAPTDPQTLLLTGSVRRVSEHPAVDRFPDVWEGGSVARPVESLPSLPPTEVDTSLVLTWEGADRQNLVQDQSGALVSTIFEPKSRAFVDRDAAMELVGGFYQADMGTMERLLGGLRATNELSLELAFIPGLGGSRQTTLFSFAGGPVGHNFSLEEDRGRYSFRLLTESSARDSRGPALDLGPSCVPLRLCVVTLTYAPGTLRAWVDGRSVASSADWREGFFHWKPLPLLAGASWALQESAWIGRILAINSWNRVLEDQEIVARAAAARARFTQLPEVTTIAVRGRLLGRAPQPTLEQIAPYRQALAVFEYEALTANGVIKVGDRLKVVHRVIADGQDLAIAGARVGSEIDLELEPFLDQPQLESLFLANHLPADSRPLLYSRRIDP